MRANRVQGRTGKFRRGKNKSRWVTNRLAKSSRNPVAKHAGINKAVTHPDQSKTIPRFRKHKLHEAMFNDC